MILQATIRFREGGYELRCERCAALRKTTAYWPLTPEFWNPIAMTRCRACHSEVKRQKGRVTYAQSPEAREKAVAFARDYYKSLDNKERAIMLDKKREQRNRWERQWRKERAEAARAADERTEAHRASNRAHMATRRAA